MQFGKLHDWLQVVGLFGVMASLLFVGLQLKQDRDLARAAAYQARADSEMSLFEIVFSSETLERAMVKDFIGEPMTDFEQIVRMMHFNPRLVYYENVHFQWEQGLVPDEHWLAQREGLKGGGFQTDLFREYWYSVRGSYRPTFAQAVDDALAELETSD